MARYLDRIQNKSLIVSFSNLSVWSVASQFGVCWNWPNEVINPLGLVLRRRNEPALDTMSPDEVVRLLTIHFDGSIEPRKPVQIQAIKGRLFHVHPGDLVFSKIDIRNGGVGLAPVNIERMCVTSEYPVYCVKRHMALPEYIKLLLRTAVFAKLLNSMISGTSGRKRIQPSRLEGVKVPVPPLAIQQKIVTFWKQAVKEKIEAERVLSDLVSELDAFLFKQARGIDQVTCSKVFLARFANTRRWDVKAGRAAAFISANREFVRLGGFIEECTETVKPWDKPDKHWPVYGVNNKTGVFFSFKHFGKEFNVPYKKIKKEYFIHNPTRANVGSLGIVPEVTDDALTSPEYQVWKLKGGFLPSFMALMLQTSFFLKLVALNRVGGVKQRMYYANLAEIRLPFIPDSIQRMFAGRREDALAGISAVSDTLARRNFEIEQIILGDRQIKTN